MKRILLTQNKKAIIDDEDFEKVNQLKWHFDGRYAANKNKKKIYLHRFILNLPSNIKIDHKDLNKLNCQRFNLRIANAQQNGVNRGLNKNNMSGYKGVYFHKQKKYKKPWVATIKVNYKSIYLGMFKTPKQAACAYNSAALFYFGNFAFLNKI
jgi:hypothetical protein